MGKSYDVYRIISLLISQSLFELKKYDDSATDKIICSHQIFQALALTMDETKSLVNKASDYEYHKLGTFTISDFVKMAQRNPHNFETFLLYSYEEIKEFQLGSKDIDFEGISVSISDEQQISKIDSFFRLIGFTKLRDLISKYEFL